MDMYAEEGDITRTLQVGIRVAAYQYGEYTEMTVSCSFVIGRLFTDVVFAVSNTDSAKLVQARSNPWTRKN